MFKPIDKGTKVTLHDAFGEPLICWVPPVGYGYNPDFGLEKTDVVKRSNKKEEQYWEREDLPEWYNTRRKTELELQKVSLDYVDPECERIREIHWRRRLYGMWFYNNGVPTYITGLHWFMLNWWRFQGKFFDFRIPNMEFFYFMDYCLEDPNCLGLIEITKRKEGKTARAGCFLYEYISRTSNKHGGIQSKTEDDAQEVFQKAITAPWRKLPHFFRPRYDTSAGSDPKHELRFFNPSKRSSKGEVADMDEALESFVDYKGSGEMAYDGPELHRYISDEAGKLIETSIVDRHNVVQFCSEIDGEFRGKHLYTTTVEDMESGGSEFQKLVKMSDRRELNDNGRTASGLYVYFLPAFRTLGYERHPHKNYGFPDEEYARNYYMNHRAALQNQPHNLSSYIRKNPFSLKEAFRVDGEKSLFNPEHLNYQLDWLNWRREEIVERGNFKWKDGQRLTRVEWVPSKTGRWQMPRGFQIKAEETNKVIKKGDTFYPANNMVFRAGGDPFKYNKAKDKRRSDCAAFVGKMHDAADPKNPFNHQFICRYRFRAATTSLANEDLLMMCWFFGCQILFESNVDHWKEHFNNSGCGPFLMILPGEEEPGIYSDGHGQVLQSLCDLIEDHIEHRYKSIMFIETIEEYLEFDVGNTTAFDETIASGVTLIAMKKKTFKREASATQNVSNVMRQYVAN